MMEHKIHRLTTCGFTGHRPSRLPWGLNEKDIRCVQLKERIYDAAQALYSSGIRHYICGMAQGCDMYFCEAVISLRDEYPDITLEAAIPCETQSSMWPEDLRRRYFYLVHQCDFETLVQREFTQDCMLKRNRYIVDNSSVLIAVCSSSGPASGTTQTVNYAKKSGLDIIRLTP